MGYGYCETNFCQTVNKNSIEGLALVCGTMLITACNFEVLTLNIYALYTLCVEHHFDEIVFIIL